VLRRNGPLADVDAPPPQHRPGRIDRRPRGDYCVDGSSCRPLAAIIAAFYALTLVRLWRRVYRRHHYRVPVALGGWVATNNDADADEIVARTKDISFGGASLVLARSIKPGARVTVILLGAEPLTIDGTVISCAPGRRRLPPGRRQLRPRRARGRGAAPTGRARGRCRPTRTRAATRRLGVG
jgi:PilZ domain